MSGELEILLEELALNEKKALKTKEDWNIWADKVATAYEARPVVEQSMKASYDALITHNNKMFKQILTRLDIEFSDRDPYKSYKQMKREVGETKSMRIFKGGSAGHPFFTEEENHIFRAVHDYLGHIGGKNSFSLQGELSAYTSQAKTIPPKARKALFCEIVGQICMYFSRGRKFVEIQKSCELYGIDFVNLGVINDELYAKNFK
jgi:hypothetical protein